MSSSSVASGLISNGYQPSAFYFKVVFSAESGVSDTSFKEVSGIGNEMQTEEISECGENGYVLKLPKGFTHSKLVLKRGIADLDSPLVKYCKTIFEGGLDSIITTVEIMVYLMNEDKTPIRGWSFTNAYPVKWDIDSFESMKNEVAIETIEFEYNTCSRVT